LKSAGVRLPFFTFGPVTAFFFSCAVPTEFLPTTRLPAAWPSGVDPNAATRSAAADRIVGAFDFSTAGSPGAGRARGAPT
jgi:hypothetical protein